MLSHLGALLALEKPTVLVVCCHCVPYQQSSYLVFQHPGHDYGIGELVQQLASVIRDHNAKFKLDGIRELVFLVCNGGSFSETLFDSLSSFGVVGIASTNEGPLTQLQANDYCAALVRLCFDTKDFEKSCRNAARDVLGSNSVYYGGSFTFEWSGRVLSDHQRLRLLVRNHYCQLTMKMIDHDGPWKSSLLCDAWIRLKIAENNKKLKSYVRHDMNSTSKLNDQIASFFDGRSNRFLVQGRAGLGKSTFAKYVCQQWALGKLWNDKFDFVVLVPLLDVVKCVEWEHAITNAFKNMNIDIDGQSFWGECQCNNDRVLWVLDGADEVSHCDVGSWVHNMLNDKSFVRCALITTCPEAKDVISRVCVWKSKDSLIWMCFNMWSISLMFDSLY
jgi:hypothetical protein